MSGRDIKVRVTPLTEQLLLEKRVLTGLSNSELLELAVVNMPNVVFLRGGRFE